MTNDVHHSWIKHSMKYSISAFISHRKFQWRNENKKAFNIESHLNSNAGSSVLAHKFHQQILRVWHVFVFLGLMCGFVPPNSLWFGLWLLQFRLKFKWRTKDRKKKVKHISKQALGRAISLSHRCSQTIMFMSCSILFAPDLEMIFWFCYFVCTELPATMKCCLWISEYAPWIERHLDYFDFVFAIIHPKLNMIAITLYAMSAMLWSLNRLFNLLQIRIRDVC